MCDHFLLPVLLYTTHHYIDYTLLMDRIYLEILISFCFRDLLDETRQLVSIIINFKCWEPLRLFRKNSVDLLGQLWWVTLSWA
jgi:hypothetical protein